MNAACIDAHIHLDMYEDSRRQSLLAEAKQQGIEMVVAVSRHLASCKETNELANRYNDYIMPAYGFHPEQPIPTREEQYALFNWMEERYLAGEKFAVGEVGLPYYTRMEKLASGESFDDAPYAELLEKFIILAAKWDRPIVLHAVYEDASIACDLLEKHGVSKAHFHWFKGDTATIVRMEEAGYYISVTPDVQYEEEIEQLVRQYPIHLLMVETDGPWPFEQQYAERETVPAMARDAALCVAKIKGLSEDRTLELLLANTKRLYQL